MALDARSRSSIYHSLVPVLGEADANTLMSEFPSVEADELVTKQFLRAELAELRSSLPEQLVTKQFLRAELAELRSSLPEQLVTKQFLRAELAEALHRQTLWMAGAIGGSTVLLAALGALT